MNPLDALVLFLSLVSLQSGCTAISLFRDVSALQQFKASVANKTVLASWVGLDPCGSKWLYVGCEASFLSSPREAVTSLIIEDQPLGGSIAYSMSELRELRQLVLTNVGISGSIPTAIFFLPNLTKLVLDDNNLNVSGIPSTGLNPSLWTSFQNNVGCVTAICSPHAAGSSSSNSPSPPSVTQLALGAYVAIGASVVIAFLAGAIAVALIICWGRRFGKRSKYSEHLPIHSRERNTKVAHAGGGGVYDEEARALAECVGRTSSKLDPEPSGKTRGKEEASVITEEKVWETPKKGRQCQIVTSSPSTSVEPSVDGSFALQVFSYSELMEATENFDEANIVGSGGFGIIYRGVLGKREVAVKVLDLEGKQGEREFQSEVVMLGRLRSPYLVELIGYCADEDHRVLVYDFMPNGSLDDLLHRKGSFRDHYEDGVPHLDWMTRMRIALDAAKGLEYLHEKVTPGVIHRDLKSSNVLVDRNFRAHIADFGLARDGPVGDKRWVSTRILGTTGYLAPEYVMTGRLTAKSDVYSFGVVLLELLTGLTPIDHSRPPGRVSLTTWALSLLQQRERIMELIDPNLQGHVALHEFAQAASVAAVCVQSSPDYRPHMEDVVQSLMPLVHNASSSHSFN